MIEIQRSRKAHPDYRFIRQEIWRKIQSVPSARPSREIYGLAASFGTVAVGDADGV